MSKNIFVIHGRASVISSSRSSIPERIKDLESRWIKCIAPQLDPSEDPTYESWEQDLKNIDFSQFDAIIASSHGGWVITKFIIENDIKIERIVMIAPWGWTKKRKNTGGHYQKLLEQNINLGKYCKEIFVISSKDDDCVPHETSKEFCKKIWWKFIAVDGYWHSMQWKWIRLVNDFVEKWYSDLVK